MLLFLVPLVFAVTALGIVTAMLRDVRARDYPSSSHRPDPMSSEPLRPDRASAAFRRALEVASAVAEPVWWRLRALAAAASTRAMPATRRERSWPAAAPASAQRSRRSVHTAGRRDLIPKRAWKVSAAVGAVAITLSAVLLARGALDDTTAADTGNTSTSVLAPAADEEETATTRVETVSTTSTPAGVPTRGAASEAVRPAGQSATPAAPTPVPPDRATLSLLAQQDAQVRVTVDGAIVFTGILHANEAGSWEGSRRVQVSTDNGKNLLVTVNGHALGTLSTAVGHSDWNSVDWGWPAGWSP